MEQVRASEKIGRETGRSALVDGLIVVFSPDESLSEKIKFPIEISKNKTHGSTFLRRSFQLVWTTTTTSTGGIQIASFRSRAYAPEPLCSALHSYWRIDQTQQEDHAVRCWLIPIGMSMCTSRNLALSMFDWKHLLPFSDHQRSEPVIRSAINATCPRHHLIFGDNDERLHLRLPIFPWQAHVYVRFNWLINKSCSKRRKCLISSLYSRLARAQFFSSRAEQPRLVKCSNNNIQTFTSTYS